MQKYVLDFSLLPDLKYSVWLYTLGNEIENSLRALPKTLGRAEAAMFFVYQLACSDDSGSRKEAYLRAALAEFVSMEEMLARDLANLGKSEPILKCIDTKDPLIHIAKALRNLEIHLQSSKMSSFETQYWFGPTGKPEDEKLMEHVVWHINDVTLDAFKDLRSAKKYDVNDVTKLLDWFNKAQKLWGIYEIVRRAIIRYSEQIIAKKLFVNVC